MVTNDCCFALLVSTQRLGGGFSGVPACSCKLAFRSLVIKIPKQVKLIYYLFLIFNKWGKLHVVYDTPPALKSYGDDTFGFNISSYLPKATGKLPSSKGVSFLTAQRAKEISSGETARQSPSVRSELPERLRGRTHRYTCGISRVREKRNSSSSRLLAKVVGVISWSSTSSPISELKQQNTI